MLMRKDSFIGTLIIIGLILFTITGFVVAQQKTVRTTIPSSGSVTAIGLKVFEDEGLTTRLTALTWGTLDNNTINPYSVWVYNDGNSPILLSFYTENWSSTLAEQSLDLTWDYSGQTIEGLGKLEVIFYLSVNSVDSSFKNFSFDITIVGTG